MEFMKSDFVPNMKIDTHAASTEKSEFNFLGLFL